MQIFKSENKNLSFEEKRSLKLYITLFYIISIGYDVLYFYIYPDFLTKKNIVIQPEGLGVWLNIIMLGLLPVSYILIKTGYHYGIKYLYFITYTFLTLINELIIFSGDPSLDYKTGNVIEVYWLILSPVFVNKRFYKLVTLGLIFKYLVVGVYIQNPVVLIPVAIVFVISLIAYILLYRTLGYVDAIKHSYDEQLEGIVKGIIATLELKDPYTKGHSERVARYAQELAREINTFTDSELKAFNYACLLHDVGKINIPDSILMKPSNLTDEEFDIIKTHPEVGANAVIQVEGLQDGLSVIRSHHERWDGKGYPDNLKEYEIPLLARITSIADAFDAITSTRSYRSALTTEDAFHRIIEGSGTQFDPTLIDIFKKVFPKWVDIHIKYNKISNDE